MVACFLARSDSVDVDGDQPKVEKFSLKKKGLGSEARAERMANADADLQLLNEAERGRQLRKQKKRRLQGREDDVCYDFLIIIFMFQYLIPVYSFYWLMCYILRDYPGM